MKLVYRIEDKFYWIHNFLPITEYKLIHNKVFKDRKKLNYNSTKNTWQKQLIDNLNAPDKVAVTDNDFDYDLEDFISVMIQITKEQLTAIVTDELETAVRNATQGMISQAIYNQLGATGALERMVAEAMQTANEGGLIQAIVNDEVDRALAARLPMMIVGGLGR
jgi:hypothetical protein